MNAGNVFYNPVQQFNRELSLSVLATFSKLYREEQITKEAIKKKSKPTNADSELTNTETDDTKEV